MAWHQQQYYVPKCDGSAYSKAVNRGTEEARFQDRLQRKAPAERACNLAKELKAAWKGIPGAVVENRGKVIYIRLAGAVIGEVQVAQEVA
mgnify:CR=1 FL=1